MDEIAMKKTIKILLETDTYQLARHLTYMDCKVIMSISIYNIVKKSIKMTLETNIFQFFTYLVYFLLRLIY